MSALESILRAVTAPPIRADVRRRITMLDGAEHIPATGAFVIAPNHTSYYDHFVVETVLRDLRGTPTWFLTKKESFVSTLKRVWHEVWYSIPVDRENPGPSTIREVQAVLRGGGALAVYPEGTRGPGGDLLPFHAGAFRFALAGRVPVIPVALVGTDQVLPRGARFPKAGSIRVAIGAPLEAPAGVTKVIAAEHLAVACRREMERLLEVARTADDDGARATATSVARVVSARLDAALAEGEAVPEGVLDQAEATLAVARRIDRRSGAVQALRVRVSGLRAQQAGGARRLAGAAQVRLAGERVLRNHPEEPMAHYLLGRWHLAAPSALGARPTTAARHFAQAAAGWPAGDVRALLGLADALEATGDVDGVRDALERAVHTGDRSLPGGPRRLERARARLAALPARAGAVVGLAPTTAETPAVVPTTP